MVLDKLTKVGKVGLGVFVAGTAVFLVAFSTPYWGEHRHFNFGLWEVCKDSVCQKTVGLGDDGVFDTDWFRGTQALVCLALLALIGDYVVRIMYLCGKPAKFLMLSVFLDTLAALLAFLAAVVFGSEIDQMSSYSFQWSFGFNIVGGILLTGAAVCFLIEFCRQR